MSMAQTIPQPAGSHLLSLPPEQREAEAIRMGIKNAGPPLPRSSHLKIKATGVVLPWDDILAEQKDLVVCCDAEGNTSPADWSLTASFVAPMTPEQEAAYAASQQIVAQQGQAMSSEYIAENAVTVKPHEYPAGVQPLDEYLLSAQTAASIQSVQALASEL